MTFDSNGVIEALQHGLSMMPSAFLVIVMLAGPTAAWLLYRFVVQPRTRRYTEVVSDLLWICERCRSANEARLSRCYRCNLDVKEILGDLQVFDGDALVAVGLSEAPGGTGLLDALPAATRPALVAVGPGRTPRSTDRPTTARPATADPPRALTPARPRKAVAASRRSGDPPSEA